MSATLQGPMFWVIRRSQPENSQNNPDGRVRRSVSSSRPDPNFFLIPTRGFYILVFVGMMVTCLPLLARNAFISLPVLLYLAIRLKRCYTRYQHAQDQLVDVKFSISKSQSHPAHVVKRSVLLEVVCLLPVTVILVAMMGPLGYLWLYSYQHCNAFASGWSCWLSVAFRPQDFAILIPLVVFGLVWWCFAIVWTRCLRGFRLPLLDREYQTWSQTIQEIIDNVTGSPPRGQELVDLWRSTPHVATHFQVAGQLTAFFRVENEKSPIWRRNLAATLWFFAPITVPLALLIILPISALLGDILATSCANVDTLFACALGFHGAERFELALASIAWAGWAMGMYIFLPERDLFKDIGNDVSARPLTEADMFDLDRLQVRHLLKENLTNTGKSAVNLLLLVMVPTLCGYFQMFPDEATRNPSFWRPPIYQFPDSDPTNDPDRNIT
jgi:hypothetical protein